MENQAKLEDWIANNATNINLNIKELYWPSLESLRLFDFSSSIEIEGRIFFGRSISRSKNLALIKSIVEAVERTICHENEINSNGIAAHVNKADAKKNALFELFERDNFLSHFLLGYTGRQISIDSEFLDISTFFLKNGLDLKAFDVSITEKKVVVVYAFKGDKSFCGLGCSTELKSAIKKALYELLTKVSFFLYRDEVKNDRFIDGPGINHLNYFEKNVNAKEIHKLKAKKLKSPHEQSADFKRIYPKSNELNDVPLYFYQAISEEVQNLYFGPITEEKVNFSRLKQLSKSPTQINYCWHPVG